MLIAQHAAKKVNQAEDSTQYPKKRSERRSSAVARLSKNH
jgi:hypothetical protein